MHVNLLPTVKSANFIQRMLQDEKLRQRVTTLSIQASIVEWRDDHEEKCPTWEVDSSEDLRWYAVGSEEREKLGLDAEVPAPFKNVLERIGQFDNMRRVELIHDHRVASPFQHQYNADIARESKQYRDTLLRKTLAALNHPDHPAIQLRSLSILNIQDMVKPEIATSADFKAVMSRLQSLEICVATEDVDYAPETEIGLEERHQFFAQDLKEYWLEPVREQLVHLKIYSNCYWGYTPKCDLRGLVFPNLKSLTLGCFSFSHDWQLDWIVSHQKLESLILDNCPIVHAGLLYWPSDQEHCPLYNHDWSLGSIPDPKSWDYTTRWHDYFRKLRTLPNLTHFAVGQGPWFPSYGLDRASEPFLHASSLPAEIFAGRYVIFESGTGPSPWQGPDDDDVRVTGYSYEDDGSWSSKIAPAPLYPDCWDEDQKALDELISVVQARKLRQAAYMVPAHA